MLNRRQLLKASAATVLLHTPVRVFSGMEREPGMISGTRVIYDTRFPESQAFAGEAARFGANVSGISGDITDLWYELASPVSGMPWPLAGLTQESDFLLLHQICIGRGCRLAYHGEHTYNSGGAPRIEHRLRAPAQSATAVKALTKSGGNWGRAVAGIVAQAKPGQHEDVTFAFDVPLVRPTQSPGHLVSWVILPC